MDSDPKAGKSRSPAKSSNALEEFVSFGMGDATAKGSSNSECDSGDGMAVGEIIVG